MALVVGLLFATLVAPAILAYKLRRTVAWWIAGGAVGGLGLYLVLSPDHSDHHGDGGIDALTGFGNLVLTVFGVFMLLYAAILLIASYVARKSQRQLPAIPTLTE